ncbi:hypothetical protein [Nocardia grenadensis]
MQIADFDRGAPTRPGNPFFDSAVAYQLLFLRRHLAAARNGDTTPAVSR